MKVEAPIYKSSDEDIAKWDEDTKSIIGVSEGTAKITVKVKVILTPDDESTEDVNEEKSYTMKRKFKLTVLTRDVEPAGKYAGDYVLTTNASDLKDGTRFILVGTRVKDDTNTDYIMGENNSMMGGGKSGSKITINGDKIPCEDVPDGTVEVVLEKVEGENSWYLNVGKDENGEKLYLYASEKKKDDSQNNNNQNSSGFNMDEMMEMFNPSSGLKVANMTADIADSCKATISIVDNIATIKYTKAENVNTIMLASAFDLESMMNMGGSTSTSTSTSSFDMGSFDLFMASFNTKKPGEENPQTGEDGQTKAPKCFMPRIYRYVPDPTFDITVDASGWSTIVTYNDVTLPETLEAYAVTEVQKIGDEKTALISPVNALRGGEPYLLYGQGGGSFKLSISEQEITAPEQNILVVSGADTADGVYVMAKPEGQEAAFYKWGGGLLGSGRVYLSKESGENLARILINYLEEPAGITTGITDVKHSSDMKAYDLQGRRVSVSKGQVKKGLYIVNGKKIVVK